MSEPAVAAASVPLAAPLRHADYRKLWAAQAISVLGDKLHQIALAILVFERTGSMLQIGAILAVTALPAALFSIPAGTLVDRWDRRRTMVAADLVRAVLVAMVPLAAGFSMVAVYVLAFVVSTVSLFFQPARLAIVPDIVAEDELMAANSLDNASMAVSELVGLAIGGVAVAALGWQIAFLADGVTFLLSAILVLSMRYRSMPIQVAAEAAEQAASAFRSFLTEIGEGFAAVRSSVVLRDLLGVYVAFAFAGYALITLGHLLALYTYDAGSVGLALLDGAITVGILVGSLLVGRTGTASAGAKFLGGTLAMGAASLALAAAPTLYVALPLMVAAGVANMFFLVPMTTLIQELSQPTTRARVFAARIAIGSVAGTVGLLGAGAIAEQIGVRSTLAATGALIIAVALIGMTRRDLRGA